MNEDQGALAGSRPSDRTADGVSPVPASIPSATLGLPYPWKFLRHALWGDNYLFAALSPRTLALGFEVLRDGLILFVGPMCFGWASKSSFDARDAEANRQFNEAVAQAMSAGTVETERLSPQDASAIPKECAQPSAGDQQ